MNKVITINLNGNAYQLEEDGFEALNRYLESAARRLEGNPDKAEIIADIEQSIGDKFRGLTGLNKTVVVTKEVEAVIAEMGPVQDASGTQDEPAGQSFGTAEPKDGAASAAGSGAVPPHRRLFRIREGAKVAGVCNGLAAYFGIEVTIVRLLFVFIALSFGAGVLAYIIMMFVIPAADTPAEKAEAYGSPATAEEFIKRAKAGYYGGFKAFKDKKAYREWKWQFKREMRQNARQWRQDWRQHWAQYHGPHDGGSWVAGSFLSLMIALVSLLGLFALLSLILTGSVFTFSLPPGMPFWMGIVLLILFFQILKWPLKAARHSMYYRGVGGPGYWCHSGGVCTFWWVVAILALVWLTNHHPGRTHEVLEQVRHETHRAVDSLRDWWDRP